MTGLTLAVVFLVFLGLTFAALIVAFVTVVLAAGSFELIVDGAGAVVTDAVVPLASVVAGESVVADDDGEAPAPAPAPRGTSAPPCGRRSG